MSGDRRVQERVDARLAAFAGAAAVAVAIGVGELLAGLVPGVTSPVVAVGDAVIAAAPGAVERSAIAVFGTANKLALNVGVVLVCLGLGAGAGAVAARRAWVAVLVFGGAGALGVLAVLRDPEGPVAMISTIAAVVAAIGVGLLVLRALLATAPVRRADRDASAEVRAGLERRRFVRLTVTVAAAGLVSAAVGRRLVQRVVTPAVALPPPVDPVAAPPSGFPVTGLAPPVVDNTSFFRIDTSLVVPRIDPVDWALRVHGMVDRELELTLDELLEMPLVERYITIACVSNDVGGSLVGNAAWTGVPLRTLLERAGVDGDADQVVGRAVDGWTAGFPTGAAFDGRDVLVAVGMNGEQLPAVHGFPARLVVAGLYGYVSATKWLTEIELTTMGAYDAYWVRRDWAKEAPVRLQSRIDVPRAGSQLSPGPVDVAGVAWAPSTGVAAVEVAVDGGSWREAELGPSMSAAAWRQWRYRWDAEAGTHLLTVRATDADGEVQTAELRPPFPDGATGHHTVEVTVS